ncbi:tetratricopeptide repeat protein [Picosynechococcus sp. PCC 11901]|uniref:lytic transglycosylase domain-containing protein n=1 Tax=Picosynechococcus sp. PCC 11901 TaxID=2579791 RepID=UPI0010FBC56F|nr:transglycosylase SLT domain-containing protein [Picosynechococcus sp. PCC 11901]QCS48814.1 tetratricopeptide repeat protein [Picosynechococcus sp. PCC 11901]
MKRVRVKYSSPTFWIGLGLTGILGLGAIAARQQIPLLSQSAGQVESSETSDSEVLALVEQTPEERREWLEAIANGKKNSLDRSRARYLLGMDYLVEQDGAAALAAFENLEQDYPVLTPHILIKRGRAYELTNNPEQAQVIWFDVVQNYPEDAAAAEALFRLSAYDPKYADQAIAEYPAHPRTQSLIQQRLAENPQQRDLLELRLKYDADAPDIATVRQALIDNFADQLSPETWQAIADSFWDQWQYAAAATAYQKAPETPQNLYRLARSFQVSDQPEQARPAYEALIKTFPDAPETGLGLRRLASLVNDTTALTYLDQAVEKFPEEAPEALFTKANLLEKLGSNSSANQTREKALNTYKDGTATTEYRWQQAERYAAEGNYTQAIEWAKAIAPLTPDHSLAPESIFWTGKWQQQLGQTQAAKQAYQQVLRDYPESYYAWRSAVQLGWDVGDFTSVRSLQPELTIPETRPVPPAGSETFQELYRLGQDFDAWNTLQLELASKTELTVPEAFTQGLLKLAQGRYLQGINTIWNLSQRDEPGDRQAWLALRENETYWHALFPFPYAEPIQRWAAENDLNPLLVVSLMRQESRFEKNIESPVGAKGLMQVMPSTAEWIAQQTTGNAYALDEPEDNIKLGTWYLRYTHQEYDDNSMLAIASYNAGPGNVAQWLQRYGLNDPDTFIEQIPFNETKNYVETVFANYWNYERLYNPELQAKLDSL